MPSGSLSIQTRLHPNPLGQWITITALIRGTYELLLVVDSGAPISAINPEIRDELLGLGLLVPARNPRYEWRLASLTVQNQTFPYIDVRSLERLTALRIDALIGLDLLGTFRAIHFYTDTRLLVLDQR